MDAAECGRVVVWAVALWALGAGCVLLAMLPGDRDGGDAGMAGGIVLGAFWTAAWYVVAMCGIG